MSTGNRNFNAGFARSCAEKERTQSALCLILACDEIDRLRAEISELTRNNHLAPKKLIDEAVE